MSGLIINISLKLYKQMFFPSIEKLKKADYNRNTDCFSKLAATFILQKERQFI